jgi:hypothetical protein
MSLSTRAQLGPGSTPHRFAAAAGTCGLLLGLAGCSGGAQNKVTAARAHPAPSGQAKPALTRARAAAFARAVVLTAADVPGFIRYSDRRGESPSEKRLEAQLHRCAGEVGSGAALLAQQSRSYRLRRDILDFSVSSEVGVARSASLAAAELAAVRSARVRTCFSGYLQRLLQATRGAGASMGSVRIAAGTPPAPGATGSFGWRITATFGVDRLRLPLYVDILGFVLGPARVTLVSSGAVRPFPAAIQQRLYSLLLSRAGARAL